MHPAHGSNVIFRREFVWGPVEEDFAAAAHTLSYRARWAALHGADRDLRRHLRLERRHRHPGRLGLHPDAQVPGPAREVPAPAGQRGARPLRRGRRRLLRHEARPQARRPGGLPGAEAGAAGALPGGPPREHARRRHAGPGPHLRRHAGLRGRRHRPRDEDARGGRPGRLFGPLAVPARQAGGRHRRPLPDQERGLRRRLGADEQDAAGSRARLRPGADQLRDRDGDGQGRALPRPRPRSSCAGGT